MTFRDLLPWNWSKCWKKWKQQRRANRSEQTMVSVYDELADFSRSFERLLNPCLPRLGESGLSLDDWGAPSAMKMPRVSVSESPTQIEVKAEVPGVNEHELEVDVQGRVLTIRGTKQQDELRPRRGYCVSRRSLCTFRRDIALPADVDRHNTQATYRKGVLTINLPKRRSLETKQIPIHAA